MTTSGGKPQNQDHDAATPEESLLGRISIDVASEHFSRERIDLVKRSVTHWTRQLIDLGGRNSLLQFRDLKAGTLDLTQAAPKAVERMLRGNAVKVTQLYDDPEVCADALRRARTIHKKAKENSEERGIETLYLGCGLASWENQRAAWQPKSPILLRRATIRPLGAAQDEFELLLVDEMEVNETLLHVLRVEFDCDLDQADLGTQIDGVIDEDWELTSAFNWIRQGAARVPSFQVEQRLVLANFAYAKLPMVRDLENAVEELVAHDIIAAIAGDEEARKALQEASPPSDAIQDPAHMPLKDEFLVLDADTSQSYAINAVVAGTNTIVRGPPGTGKSQTIANLVASLVANGKKVLFVAEKRAAIDAVLKRLHQRDLAELVLDLHGGVSTRRAFAEVLGRALDETGGPDQSDTGPVHEMERTERRRAELDDHATALHERRQPWGISIFDLRARLIQLKANGGTCEARLRGRVLQNLDADARIRIEDDLAEFSRLGGAAVRNGRSPWSRSTVHTTAQVQKTNDLISELLETTLLDTCTSVKTLEDQVGMPFAGNVSDWGPRLELVDNVGEVLVHLEGGIFEQDLETICRSLKPAAKGPLARLRAALLSSEYRRTRRLVRGLARPDAASRDAELAMYCEQALDQKRRWSDYGGTGQPQSSAAVADARANYATLLRKLGELGDLIGERLLDLSGDELRQHLDTLQSDRITLIQLPEIRRLMRSLGDAGLEDLLEEKQEDGLEDRGWINCFRYCWLQSIFEQVELTDPKIGGFLPEKHARAVVDFIAGDHAHIRSTPARIRRISAAHALEAREEFPRQDALIRHQAGLRRRHMPVRELIDQGLDVLLALKPCWAMSPLVVSQLLPKRTQFDVVIFDEASQVTPADAVASILRGKQLVVAGDEKQLPPTAFFVSDSAEDEEPEEAGATSPEATDTRGFESILDVVNTLFQPVRMLTWHYRSRDERLIGFSNAHLYGRALTTFPGIGGADVLHRYEVPWDSVSETISPTLEVNAVVDMIVDHARSRPFESLGVISMGIKHSDRIEECLRDRLRQELGLDEELAEFLREDRDEPFFVKNLERVQGDERDAIILTIGIGKNPRGDLDYRSFGPLLQDGGERRLNVAITRAKRRAALVSSFSSRDMDPARSSRKGVNLLRQYMQYMESNGTNLGDVVIEKPPLNAFELEVEITLSGQGIRLIPQYGSSGYWIDFAAQHPSRPGTFVLAIECDGATYHSSSSARQRDRLRQEQLERIGWKFCRIWSTEWFNNKERAVEKVLDAYQRALAQTDPSRDGEHGVSRPSAELTASAHAPAREEPVARREAPLREREGLDESHPQSKQGGLSEAKVEDRGGDSRASAILRSVGRSAPMQGKQTSGSSAARAKGYASARRLPVIDMRPSGGALWIVCGEEHADGLRKLGFVFVPHGGKASGHRPAWYLRDG